MGHTVLHLACPGMRSEWTHELSSHGGKSDVVSEILSQLVRFGDGVEVDRIAYR
jgi:hypothetical protein